MPSRSSSPEVNANTMDIVLDRFAACLAQNSNAIVLLDQAGWHGEKALAVPVGGAIDSIQSGRIALLPHKLSRNQRNNRVITL
jgi:hypothetical protein